MTRAGIKTFGTAGLLAALAAGAMAAMGAPRSGPAGGFWHPWTAAASAGTVDEADAGIVDYSTSLATVSAAAAVPATVDIRYNVVAVEGILDEPAHTMTVRYRDNGAQARVIVRLRRYNYRTGVTSTLMTFDSNAYAAAAGYQTRELTHCFDWSFDFDNNAYYFETEITKSGANGSPGLGAIAIVNTLC